MAAPAAFYPARRLVQLDDDRPQMPIAIDPSWPPTRRALAGVYNRVGGLMDRMAVESGVSVPAVLAVWFVESSGRDHTPGKAVIRFENHILFNLWGQNNPGLYDRHFRHGGRAPQFGPACNQTFNCHEFRRNAAGPFEECHLSQDVEYEVLDVASGLAGAEIARRCISMGGPQIMGFNHVAAGYATASEMFDAFQGPEGNHVRSFFAVAGGGGLDALRNLDWRRFARIYNGPGLVDEYAPRMQRAFNQALPLF